MGTTQKICTCCYALAAQPDSGEAKAYFVYHQGMFLTVPIVGPGPVKSRASLDLVETGPFVKTEV